jgi:hypothetical protein
MSNVQPTPRRLPTIQEIHSENPDAFKQDQFKTLVNQPPPPQWIKKHPISLNAYMPIDKIEYLLDAIVGQWKVEILEVMSLFQSVAVTIRLHYLNPATMEWSYHDGAGASPVQTDKGESAANLGAIKSNAIQLALPAAVSYALKDAAEHIGIIFGRNVSRKDTIAFRSTFTEDPYSGEQPKIIDAPPVTLAAPIAPIIIAPPVIINTEPPKFEEDFFAPPTAQAAVQLPADLNQEIEF